MTQWLPSLAKTKHKAHQTIEKAFEELEQKGLWVADLGIQIKNIRRITEEPKIIPAPEIPAPVISAPVILAPVIPAPVIPAPEIPAPEIPAPVVSEEKKQSENLFQQIFVGGVFLKEEETPRPGQVDYQRCLEWIFSEMNGENFNKEVERNWFQNNVSLESMRIYFEDFRTWWIAAKRTGELKTVVKTNKVAFLKYAFKNQVRSYFSKSLAEQKMVKVEDLHERKKQETQNLIQEREKEKLELEKNDGFLREAIQKLTKQDCAEILQVVDSKEYPENTNLKRSMRRVEIFKIVQKKLGINEAVNFSLKVINFVVDFVLKGSQL